MSEPSGRPGRYQRSASGLVVSLAVTVGAVLALLWFLGLFRTTPDIEPTPIDYLETVATLQASGARPVYPASLPEGWIATGFHVEPGEPAYELKFLTDEGQFVGVSQADESVATLLHGRVDEDDGAIEEIEDYAAAESVAPAWAGYADQGGDTAYAAEVGDIAILVYGSAPAEDLQAIIETLTRAPVTA